MQTTVLKAPNIVQPTFRQPGSSPFTRHPLVLMDGPSRWRKMADKIDLSPEGRLKLEWMIFYETAGGKNAYETAKHFGITPKTFYKWFKRFANGKVMLLEEISRTPVKRRTSTVTTLEEARIIKLRKKHIHYSKRKIAKRYETVYGEKVSAHKAQVVINKFNLNYNNYNRRVRTTRWFGWSCNNKQFKCNNNNNDSRIK